MNLDLPSDCYVAIIPTALCQKKGEIRLKSAKRKE